MWLGWAAKPGLFLPKELSLNQHREWERDARKHRGEGTGQKSPYRLATEPYLPCITSVWGGGGCLFGWLVGLFFSHLAFSWELKIQILKKYYLDNKYNPTVIF